MEKQDADKIQRFIDFGHRLFGDGHGWKKKYADALGVSATQVGDIVAGRLSIGPKMTLRLIEIGCDKEWFETGISKNDNPSGETIIQFGMPGYLSKEDAAKFKTLADKLSEVKKDDPDAVDKIIEMVDIMFRKK